MTLKLSAGALFAGIGGFCLGFDRVGIPTSWAVEFDQAATTTYQHNIQNVRLVPEDVREVTVTKSDLEPVDILHAGFPCQSFSQAGEKKGFEDARGKLFYEVIRLVKEFKDKKPAALVLENSPYLRYGDGGSWFIEISKEIRKAGYWFSESNYAELDTYALTPLPQKRNRLFMVAFSTDVFYNGKVNFPTQASVEPKQLKDYIAFESSLDDDTYYLPEVNRYHKMVSDKIDDRYGLYHLRKYLVRAKAPNECPTLTANMGLGGHNVPFIQDTKGIRKLTEYECLKLQGFPDEYTFPDVVPRAKRYIQVGNSVSPKISELLAQAVLQKFELEL